MNNVPVLLALLGRVVAAVLAVLFGSPQGRLFVFVAFDYDGVRLRQRVLLHCSAAAAAVVGGDSLNEGGQVEGLF